MTKAQGISGFALEGGPFWRKTSVRATVGETQLWTITNKAIWAHPIHLHGFFFQEVDEKGIPMSPRAWKDTIHVPVDATKRFLVKLDRPGLVDVPLPHPRSRGSRPHEHGRRRRHRYAARRTRTLTTNSSHRPKTGWSRFCFRIRAVSLAPYAERGRAQRPGCRTILTE